MKPNYTLFYLAEIGRRKQHVGDQNECSEDEDCYPRTLADEMDVVRSRAEKKIPHHHAFPPVWPDNIHAMHTENSSAVWSNRNTPYVDVPFAAQSISEQSFPPNTHADCSQERRHQHSRVPPKQTQRFTNNFMNDRIPVSNCNGNNLTFLKLKQLLQFGIDLKLELDSLEELLDTPCDDIREGTSVFSFETLLVISS